MSTRGRPLRESDPVGTAVCVTLDTGETWHSETRSEIWTLRSGKRVVQLKGSAVGIFVELVFVHEDSGEEERHGRVPIDELTVEWGDQGQQNLLVVKEGVVQLRLNDDYYNGTLSKEDSLRIARAIIKQQEKQP